MRRCVTFLALGIAALWVHGLPADAGRQAKGGDKVTQVEKLPFGKTPDGTPVELYVLTNAKGMTAKIMTYGAILTELNVARPRRQARRRRPRLRRPGGLPRRAIRISARPSAGSPTASPRASSRSTARNTSWPSTTGPNTCTAASRASTRSSGRPKPVQPPDGVGRQVHLRQPRRRGRLSRQPDGCSDLHPDRQERAEDRLHGHDRQGDAGQPDQPHYFNLAGAEVGRHPRSRADDRRRPVHAGRRRR